MRRTAALLVIVFVAAFASAARADAQDAGTGTVQGTVYWDRDADGARDDGEPPLNLGVTLKEAEGTGVVASAPNSRDGRYSITHAAGAYYLQPQTDAHAGICVDAFRGSFGPFSPSNCYSTPLPYDTAEPGEPFDLDAGATLTIDLPVTVRDQMIFSLRAIEEDHYAKTGDVVTAMVNGKACGEGTVPATSPAGQGEDDFPLLVDGDASVDGCAREGDEITFVLNGRTALNPPIAYAAFDPSNPLAVVDVAHVRKVDLLFMEHWAWFYSDDLRAFDSREFVAGVNVVAVVNGVKCATGSPAINLLYGVAGSPEVKFYGFGPILIADTSIAGGCARPGDTVEFRVGFSEGELIKTAVWQPGVHALTDIVVQRPPRTTVLLPPNTGDGASPSGKPTTASIALLALGLVALATGAALRRCHTRRSS